MKISSFPGENSALTSLERKSTSKHNFVAIYEMLKSLYNIANIYIIQYTFYLHKISLLFSLLVGSYDSPEIERLFCRIFRNRICREIIDLVTLF